MEEVYIKPFSLQYCIGPILDPWYFTKVSIHGGNYFLSSNLSMKRTEKFADHFVIVVGDLHLPVLRAITCSPVQYNSEVIGTWQACVKVRTTLVWEK